MPFDTNSQAKTKLAQEQLPHGNSLALAKECIYCIARRICLQQAHLTVSK